MFSEAVAGDNFDHLLSTLPNMSSSQATVTLIEVAFHDDAPLKARVLATISQIPQHAPLFEEIARYVVASRTSNLASGTIHEDEDGHASKKRKLANGTTPNPLASDPCLIDVSHVTLQVKEISFSIPQRKKLTLALTGDYLSGSELGGSVQALNPKSGEQEFGIASTQIQHVLCLPVPEKAQKQYNFCVIPRNGDGLSRASGEKSIVEPIIWTVPDQAPQKAHFLSTGSADTASLPWADTIEAMLHKNLDLFLKKNGRAVVYPDEKEFASATPEAHRKGEKAFHVKAFRGSKDGFLFFLPTGIFFGFKKPLAFFAFENVESISYTSVLQRTFNLNILARTSEADETEEFEFSMVDQADFAGIDAYLKKHSLQDASMAEARRAKKVNVNKKAAEVEGAEDGGEEGELQKAQRELEDQEDEEEEDYDPGSEGESEGSGTSDENEDDGGGEAVDEGEEDDVVDKELGSDTEEVDLDDENQL